ncbi:MAG: LysM peptidoglycan-binding domain-containing protein [Rhodobacteraceae bacterium]|nr:LysM peptidoglycan-binding domain-containing protein [Paracoccaceae bacterium]
MLATESGVRVIQPPGAGPEIQDEVVVDAISYSVAGEVRLAGRGLGGEFARVYVNNRPVQTVPIGEGGDWSTDLPDVASGVYTLRVDQVDAGGRVTSRFETPFQREDPAVLAVAFAAQAPERGVRAQILTVQPGYTLWGIARRTYGNGFLYVRVFEANRRQIRDPDLIYPGQVFTLPE